MKKILFLIFDLGGGGAERLLTDLVNYLDETKYEITVQTFYDQGIYRKELKKSVRYKTIVSGKQELLKRMRGRFVWMVLPPAITYLWYVKEDYDYEIAFLEGIPVKILSASTNTKAKKLTWVHTDLYTNYWTKLFFRNLNAQRRAYQKYERVICVSKSARDGFVKRFGDPGNLRVMYNFIDGGAIIRKAGEMMKEPVAEVRFRMLAIGRLVVQKGYDRLLRVCRRLKQRHAEFELWILGEGKERSRLENYIEKHGLTNYVKLWGFQKNPYKFMKYCHLMVCSSRSEGYGIALAEAMYLGLPVVSTFCAGPDELTGKGAYGLLVDNNEKALAEGIIKMYESEELRSHYAKAARKRAEAFVMEKRIKDFEALFLEEEELDQTGEI